jgi:hypothetical protein
MPVFFRHFFADPPRFPGNVTGNGRRKTEGQNGRKIHYRKRKREDTGSDLKANNGQTIARAARFFSGACRRCVKTPPNRARRIEDQTVSGDGRGPLPNMNIM